MTARSLEQTLWIGTLAMLVLAGVRGYHARSGQPTRSVEALPVAEREPGRAPSAKPSESEIAAADPFRVVRHASPVAYRPELEGVAPPSPPPKPPHPILSLTGILGGPPWDALVDGIPGHEGSLLVHTGQTIGALRVRSITRDTVIVTGEDTTWRLALKRSWQ